MNIGFISLGCNKNLVDTEIMVGMCKESGFDITDDEALADVIVVNTCAFIDDAKSEAIDAILGAARYKEGRLKKLIVTGCLAQRYREEILSEMPEVDAVVGVGRFEDIVKIIKSDEKLFTDKQESLYPEYAPRVLSTPPYTAYLKIAEGCDNRCTYCAIPMIRGRLRSRRIEDILAEAQRLADGGVREINVVAQDTTRYGVDIYGEPRLTELLRRLEKTDGIKWIRALYTYPEMISDELLDLINSSDKIASYFDIPIQHISDPVLKRMNRQSTGKEIYGLIEKIRAKVKDPVLRTTLIVGFPGETSEDFEKLRDFVKFAEFDRLGVFKYSREEGTPAYKLPDQINDDIKALREGIIMQLQQGISARKLKSKTGNTYEVLKEGNAGGKCVGRTMGDAPEVDGRVIFDSARKIANGEFVKVKITDANSYDLIGVLKDEYTE